MGGGSTSNHQVAIIAGMSSPANSASVFASNTWYRFVYTMSGNGTNSTWKMYGDNVERQTITSTPYNPDTTIQAQMLFGTYNSTSEFSRHYLADMKIYNKTLTLQQLNQRHNPSWRALEPDQSRTLRQLDRGRTWVGYPHELDGTLPDAELDLQSRWVEYPHEPEETLPRK